MSAPPATLGEILPRAARIWGGRPALTVGERMVTFAELDAMAGRVAGGLRAAGIVAGDRVTLSVPNSLEYLVCYHGIARMGGVVNPLNALLTLPELLFAARDCGARAVIAPSDKAMAISREMGGGIVVVATDGAACALGLVSLVQFKDARPLAEPVAVSAGDLSTIAYTSGTTGHPKGAMLSHRAVVMNAAMTAHMHARCPLDTVVTALPCPHVYGMAVANAAALRGQHLVLMPRFDAAAAIALIEAHRATMFEGVPAMYIAMLGRPELDNADLSSLTRCTVGGQTMPTAKMEEVEKRFGCQLIELWGMTEIAGLGTTFGTLGPRILGSIGIPLPWTAVRIASVSDPSAPLRDGEVGELQVRGPTVMDGYWGNAAATLEALAPDGWMRSGDLARQDEHGCVFIMDRMKDLIITGGYNIYPAELEQVLAAHPGVAMAAVAGMPDAEKGELAKAYIVPKAGVQLDGAELDAFCRARLAVYKCPRSYAIVDQLPMTSTGKILRRALRDVAMPSSK